MHVLKIILLALVLSSVYVNAAKWIELKSLNAYQSSEYHLKNGVDYLEVREYIWQSPHKVDKNSYRVVISAYKTPLKSFKSKKVKKFKALAPNFTKEANIREIGHCLMSGCTFSRSNGFMIDKDGKMWRMNEVSDVIKYLGTIDTPAELKLVLWLNSEAHDKDKYWKTSNGYTVISEYDNSIDNFGECGHFVYRLKINKKGEITEKKLLKKTASKHGCVTAD
jgi:hypothetical protein